MPTSDDEKLLKEGDGGSSINGLNGVVFTSSNAGIFTETHGGNRKVARKRKKTKRRQDRKRRELLGKDKKNGVEKLDAFVRENSPLNKAVNRRMDGSPNVPPRGADNLRRLEYKKTSKNYGVSKDNEPNSSMSGLNGKIDASSAVGDTLADDITISRQVMPAKPKWNEHHVLQQADLNTANIGPQPNQNTEANPPKFVERGKDPNKIAHNADIKMGDFMTRVRKYEDEDAGVEQPLGAASAASKTIQNQMSQWGSYGSVDRDENKRGGENDKIDSELNEYFDESESAEIIEEIKRLQDKKKKQEGKGGENALFLAMMNDE